MDIIVSLPKPIDDKLYCIVIDSPRTDIITRTAPRTPMLKPSLSLLSHFDLQRGEQYNKKWPGE